MVLSDHYQVHTDEGAHGLGEESVVDSEATHALVQRGQSPQSVGVDPEDIELLLHSMYRPTPMLGPMRRPLKAIASIDFALTATTDKVARKPFSALARGNLRESVEAYASSMTRGGTTVDEAQQAADFHEEGYCAGPGIEG